MVLDEKSIVLNNVQMTRLFAALLVIVHHVRHEMLDNGIVGWQRYQSIAWFDGSVGVDIFFVISGLIMIIATGKNYGSIDSAGQFMKRRLSRIVPLYWIFTVLMLLVMMAVPGRIAHGQSSLGHIVGSFIFFPVLDAHDLPQPVLGVGWTLNYEMYFYTVFSIGLLFRKRVAGLAWVFGFIGVTTLVGTVLSSSAATALLFWTNPIVLEFLFGMSLGVVVKRGVRLTIVPALVLVLAGIGALGLVANLGWPDTSLRWLAVGIPATMIVAGAALGPQLGDQPIARMLRLGGDASYALYLSHPFTINIVAVAWRYVPGDRALLFLLTAAMGSLLTSILVFLLVERPILDMLNKKPNVLMNHPLLFFVRRRRRPASEV